MNRTLLIANRGEVAIRINRAAQDLGWRTVAVYSDDDASSLHHKHADVAVSLGQSGAAAYLNIDRVLEIAADTSAGFIHPGYGFLAENPEFARRCEGAGIAFVGPTAELLTLFGDKATARSLAERLGVPVLRGTPGGITPEDAAAFAAEMGGNASIILKAIAGGGGRGSRVVEPGDDLDGLFERCASEALASFGDGSLLAEQFLPRARHIEVQIVGDGQGGVSHLWDRDCSVQRRHQKIVELAPAITIDPEIRKSLIADAVTMATDVSYRGLGTFEFLVDADTGHHVFIEANPRLQVEHTVTEEVLGIDLVQAQLLIAQGQALSEIGLSQSNVSEPRGIAVQCRVNLETMAPDGSTRPGGGTLTAFEVPTGPGVRTDTFGYTGYTTSSSYDSLLAKIIVHTNTNDLSAALAKTDRALRELRADGVKSNQTFLRAILQHPEVAASQATTRFVDLNVAELVNAAAELEPSDSGSDAPSGAPRLAGTKVDDVDPLAVLDFGQRTAKAATQTLTQPTDGTTAVLSPLQGTIVALAAELDQPVAEGQALLIMEAMKMEHVVTATHAGFLRRISVEVGDVIYEGQPLAFIETADVDHLVEDQSEEIDLDEIRPDLASILDKHAATLDEARPHAVARRRATNQRTARENIADLCDDDSFAEYGQLALAPGTGLSVDEILNRYPADGLIAGTGNINASLFGADKSRAVICSYDYTVFAGTQGPVNHPKTDRMLDIALRWKLPLIFFTEGGGGRAGTGGDRDGTRGKESSDQLVTSRPLVTPTFTSMARLNGVVPTIGINSGRCFAGNAAILGACDVVIATEDSNIGMGGPAMVEGGGLGVFSPDEIGPIEDQVASGVVDIRVPDEAHAVAAAKQYLSYFQGPVNEWDAPDARELRFVVPDNRLRAYEMRRVIEGIADVGSVLELRAGFGLGMITAFGRIEGRSVGFLANNPNFIAGAIDSDGADKAARFMQLCDAFDIPIVVLCDTPGIMVGPEVERTGLVRHCNRLFITGANLSTPSFMVVIRKAYGLGALAMAGGSVAEPMFCVSWPTGEFAGMGLEGQVKLGYRQELQRITDPAERRARYEELVAQAYDRSKAANQAHAFGIDDVIDPKDTRKILALGLASASQRERDEYPRRVDVW